MTFYDLICEDYTRLGGPMGTESTSEIFRKAFSTPFKAKQFAEKDHRNRDHRKAIEWTTENGTQWYSGDLLSHAYSIEKRTSE